MPSAPDPAAGGRRTAAQAVALWLVEGYRRFISPLFGPHCRFHPTCSAYAAEAIEGFGAWRGLLLATGRVLRCNPLFEGGLDPVPEQFAGRRRRPAAPERP